MTHTVNTEDDQFPFLTTWGIDYISPKDGLEKGFKLEQKFEIEMNNHPTPKRKDTGRHDPYGTPITKAAANKMVEQYWDNITGESLIEQIEIEADNEVKDSALAKAMMAAPGYVIFNKEAIAFLLSQKNCTGIKFYFCLNHNNEKSLVLVGVDENDCDLGCISTKGSIIDMDFPESITPEKVKNTAVIEKYESGNDAQSFSVGTGAVSREKSSIIEVGGPNFATKIVTLWDIHNDKIQDDSYGEAFKKYLKR